jgi:UDP-N-acetylglucosamine 2-epimerase (non-hydrolysing)
MAEIAVVLGTRPEAVKLAPVIEMLRRQSWASVRLCSTGQHREMLDQTLRSLDLVPDLDLRLMQEDQAPAAVAARILTSLSSAFAERRPDLVLVQGDTTTAFVASLAAFYAQIPVGHVEAGLRTHDKRRPFPEEINRRLTAPLADLHFAPTEGARQALLREGVPDADIVVTGNTVVDVLLSVAREVESRSDLYGPCLGAVDPTRRMVLVTGHRRESFGYAFEQICLALRDLAERFEDVEIVYPVHLNPKVQEPVRRILGGIPRVHLLAPADYKPFVFMMTRCHLILTDSGGIQEEAPSLGKPVLVMREKTERPEGLAAGTSRLVGVDRRGIVEQASLLLTSREEYARMTGHPNPYGDGRASERIVARVRAFLDR